MLKLAVAGHRCLDARQIDRIVSELDRIAADIIHVLLSLTGGPFSNSDTSLHREPVAQIRLLSSLAEGADRLAFAAERFQQNSAVQLERAAILPFPRAIFCGDFNAENSVVDRSEGTVGEFLAILEALDAQNIKGSLRELDGDTERRDHAYNACSKALVDASDLLIAIYDKKHYSGVGTAYTIQCAQEKGIPVVHIPNSEGPSAIMFTDKAGERQTKPYSQAGLLAVLQKLPVYDLHC